MAFKVITDVVDDSTVSGFNEYDFFFPKDKILNTGSVKNEYTIFGEHNPM